MYTELWSLILEDFPSLLTLDALKEGLTNYVQDKYLVAEGIEELPKKSRKKALGSQKRRTAPGGASSQTNGALSKEVEQDKPVAKEAMHSAAGSCSDGKVEDIMILMPESKWLTETLESLC